MNYRKFLSEAAKSQNMIMTKNLNEDQRTDLIQEITSRIQTLGVGLLKEILSSLKTQEEKKFNGRIDVASYNGSSLFAGDFFDNVRELKAKLVSIDPSEKKKVEKILSDYGTYNYKTKFIRTEKKCDVYHCVKGDPRYPLVVFLSRE